MKSLGKMLFLASVMVFLNGFACSQNGPTTPSVTLSITAGTPVSGATVTGYWIYRSVTPVCNTVAINPSAVTGTTYTDTTVLPGTTYYYCATAAAGTTNSPYSNMVTAAVPPAPNAPALGTPTEVGTLDVPARDEAPRLSATVNWTYF